MRSLLLGLLVIAITGCQQVRQQENSPALTEESSKPTDSVSVLSKDVQKLNLQLDDMREIDTSGVMAYLLHMGEAKERDGGSSLRSYKEMPENDYWNIIFYDSKTGNYHLLSDRKMVVRQFDSNDGELTPLSKKPYILYRITVDDHNMDAVFTHEDPEYLFVTDKQGNNFRQLSPSGYDLIDWKYISTSGKIISIVRKDSDGNKKFDMEDEVTCFEAILDSPSAPREIFSHDFKNNLKVLYSKDWKKIKK